MFWKDNHRFTRQEQKDLINALLDKCHKTHLRNFIGNGGGRLVFEHPFYEDRVVKVAMGEGGVNQNKLEIRTYLDYAGCYDIFANIFGFEDLVLEMEKVAPYDIDNLDEEDEYEDYEAAWDTKYLLDDILGETADNQQLGKNEDGKWVAYDYGYTPEFETSTQVSDIRDLADYSYDFIFDYLQGILSILDNEITMIQLEFDTIHSYYEDYDEEEASE